MLLRKSEALAIASSDVQDNFRLFAAYAKDQLEIKPLTLNPKMCQASTHAKTQF